MQQFEASLLSQLPDGVIVTNTTGEILWANPACCDLTGYTLDSLIGCPLSLLVETGTELTGIRRVPDTVLADGSRQRRLAFRRADGTWRHAALSFIEINASGDSYVVCSMRDVSADVQLEQHLSLLRAETEWSQDVTITALASLAEQKDECTGAHLQRLESYTFVMATWLLEQRPEAFPEWARDARMISRCSVLHDIGKVGIPDAVLTKAGPLTPDEQRVMREHPRLGAQIIERLLESRSESPFLRIARDIIAYHHEQWDGTGYPYGLRGDAIPIFAQLTTVADVFDALTSKRPYKEAYRFEQAAEWIRKESGRRLGPLAVEAFDACLPAIEEIHARLGDVATQTTILPSGMMAESQQPSASHLRLLPHRPSTDQVIVALQEGLLHPTGGEVLIRTGETTGRVFIHAGRVAWASLSSDAEALSDLLPLETKEMRRALLALIDECRRSGASLVDAIDRRQLVPRPVLRKALHQHLLRKMQLILMLPEARAMFVPQARQPDDDLCFSLHELLEGIGRSESRHPGEAA